MTGPVKKSVRANPGGSKSAREREGAPARLREGAHARGGGAEGKDGSSRSAPAAQGARARVQARARVSSASTIKTVNATRLIAIPAMLCARPEPFAVALVGTSPEVMSTFVGLCRGDLVEIVGELRLADLGEEGARLAILVAAARRVSEAVAEVDHEA